MKCQTPINQLACRVDPNGYVQGVWYGAWGANSAMTAAGPQPYIQGDSNFWYTQNWCDKWGLESKCVNGNPSPPAGAGPTTKGADVVYNLANGFSVTPAGVPTQTITYVTAMAVCYKNGKIGKVTWTTLPFTANWEASTSIPLNPPMSVVTPSTAAPSTVSCGTISDCDHTEVFTAPTGKVLGGFTHKCKYTQGWGRFAVNGAQHPTQRLDHIEKACAVTRECTGFARVGRLLARGSYGHCLWVVRVVPA